MKVEFRRSFLSGLRKLKNKKLKETVVICILQVEKAKNPGEIKNLKKLTGYDFYYRIRIGDYRIGVKIDQDTVFFVVFEHRKDIYKGFP